MTSAKLSLFPPPQKNPGSWLVLEETEATGGGGGSLPPEERGVEELG